MQPTDKKLLPVYASWKTVENSIEALSRAAIPNVIDRSVFPGLNWGVQGHLLSALKFLGLTEENGTPSEDLKILVHEPDKRKDTWRRILQEKYPQMIALDLTRTTPNQLTDTFRDLGLSGDTLNKAVRFFLSAATFSEMPISAHLGGRKLANSGARRKRANKIKLQPDQDSASSSVSTPTAVSAGANRSIRLRSGGTLTMSASVDLFSMSSDDRKFVFDLIDQIQAYERSGVDAE